MNLRLVLREVRDSQTTANLRQAHRNDECQWHPWGSGAMEEDSASLPCVDPV